MIEREQKLPQITLNQYKGFGRDLVQLNQAITDGFVKTADIRSDIVIVKKDPNQLNPEQSDRKERILNKLPNKTWQNTNTTEVRRDHKTETWYLGIDDDKLFKETRDGSTKITFDEQYVTAFQSAIASGLRSVLKKEKLLNSEKYNETFISGYLNTGLSLGILVFMETATILSFHTLPEITLGSTVALGSSAIFSVANNSILNIVNYSRAWLGDRSELQMLHKLTPYSQRVSLNDPFIKHDFGEIILPIIPLDKLIKGTLYLNHHQHELLKPLD